MANQLAATDAVLRPYEGIIIVKAETSEEKQKALFQKNKQIIESFKGTVNHVDTWGRRKLANMINKERTGIYFHTTFSATPAVIAELERTMRINDDVLRFMHTRLEDNTDLAKHVEQFKEVLAANQRREKDYAERAQARKREMRPSV